MNQDVKALEEALQAEPGPRGNMLTTKQAMDYAERCFSFQILWVDATTPDRIRRLLDYIRKLEQEAADGK